MSRTQEMHYIVIESGRSFPSPPRGMERAVAAVAVMCEEPPLGTHEGGMEIPGHGNLHFGTWVPRGERRCLRRRTVAIKVSRLPNREPVSLYCVGTIDDAQRSEHVREGSQRSRPWTLEEPLWHYCHNGDDYWSRASRPCDYGSTNLQA